MDNERVPGHVEQSVDAIADIERQSERSISPQQRRIEWTSAALGRPRTSYAILAFAALWIAGNLALGQRAFDPAPFSLLQTGMSLCALLMTTVILTTENRQSADAERRATLSLQMTSLTETKVAKLIELIERLRDDSPDVVQRHDPEAREMQSAADPKRVLEVMEARQQSSSSASAAETQGATSDRPAHSSS
jgi:uncharacterized membrane protein